MGGIGKTTLAKKLFDEPSIKHHFHKRAFCSVSQVYRKRKVLLDIWSGLSLNGDEIHQMDDDKLAHRLRQSLLVSRYLIVVDDIWDVDVWYDIRALFPDDRKGSRVIFTTRINIVSLTAKPDSAPCQLPFLSIDKSWELLQQKVFHRDPCPPHLLEVGKMIATNCEGLLLSIVVIAGHLKRAERSLVYWKEVGDTLSSFASSEGCYEIIKLSYKHLPVALKSCFLYLGLIPEDETLKAGQLALLWVAEGLVLKSEGDSLLKIAEKYLNDLGDRNLVTVNRRKYNGGIHVFCLHNLIRDFCRTEAQEENVLHEHRISILGDWRSFVNAKPRVSTVHSLLFLASARSSEICEVKSLQSFLSNFKLVTVLNLMAIVIDGEFPTTVTTLVHLRYLALRFSAKLDVPDCDPNLLSDFDFLATSISQLYKLEPETNYFHLPSAENYSLVKKIYDKSTNCRAEVTNDRYFQNLMISFFDEAEPSCFTSLETTEFLDSVHTVLNDVLRDMDKSIIPNLDSQIEYLVQVVVFLLRNLVYYTQTQFNVHDWANKAACLSLLHGLVGIDKETSRRLFIDLQTKVDPCNPEFIKLCFEAIKVPKMKPEDRLLFGEFVSRFVDFFLDNLVFILNDDDFPMVREGLIFIITFLADPPANTMYHSELLPFVRERIYSVLDLASDIICFFREANIDLSSGKTILDDFLKSIDEVRGDIIKLYVNILPSSLSNFPRIDTHGYFECLLAYLENLKDTMNNNRKAVPFLEHQIFTIHQELLPLRLFPQDTLTMQNEHSGLKDIWEQLMSLLYQVDFAIKSFFFIDDAIWYNMTCLSFVSTKIKDTRYRVKNIEFETRTEGSQISRTESILPLMSSTDASTSTVEAVVGFEKETKLLIDSLIGGSKQLDIVSIVGMGGIGKTTLAKKLFDEKSIKDHFHKRAFCSVSQVYRKRNVLLKILSGLSLNGGEIHQMDDDELAHRLRKSLNGFRYLIVVDDIWDINVWEDLRHSFPDDRKGSRVIFTTRINTISLIAKPDSSPCLLPFLSNDESWELLQQKLFHKDPCPEHLLQAGNLIAKNCRGLPLAIVLIAGLLARTERSLLKWNEVADTLSSSASSEGCHDIIKLSYKHLPGALKSCFLYLGAFREDEILKAKKLALLCVAEGFVLKSGSSSLYKIAKKYLNDLGDRNLLTITERSCNGGIKTFRVHDLIRDFCRSEAQEEHYMCYINADYRNLSLSSVLYEYRISIEAEWRSFVDACPPFMFSIPASIRKLTLEKFNLPWNEFSAVIGKLSCLEVLVLGSDSFKGRRWDVEDDEFQNIKSLTLKCLDIKEWNASTDSFPSLEKLVVYECLSLIEIPPCFSDVVTLNYIKVDSCGKSVADSAIRIQEDQIDSGNEKFEVDLVWIKT